MKYSFVDRLYRSGYTGFIGIAASGVYTKAVFDFCHSNPAAVRRERIGSTISVPTLIGPHGGRWPVEDGKAVMPLQGNRSDE